MDWIQNIIDNTQFPVVTAFLLGLAVALHPCPLATNIAAMGYMAKDVSDRRRVFMNGLFYTLGRILAYSVLGVVLAVILRGSADMLSVGRWFGEWGERLLSPVLIIAGLYFLMGRFLHRHEHCPDIKSRGRRFRGLGGSMLLGVLLALSFCPESAIVYFGMLMPMSANLSGGYLLPVVFSLATAIPAVLLAWGASCGISGTEAVRGRVHIVRKWTDTVIGILFIGAGVFCAFF